MKFISQIIHTEAIPLAIHSKECHRFDDFIERTHGKILYLSIEPQKKPRSNNQNRYYHGVVLDILENHTGHEAEEIHELMKTRFLSKRSIQLGKTFDPQKDVIAGSTANLSTDEMESYLAQIRQWASLELGCYIPLPNEVEGSY